MKLPISPERLDLSDMRRRLGNDDALIADVLGMFVEAYGAQLAAVKAAVEDGNADAVRRTAHAFKGFAGNLSAAGVGAAAIALEEAGEHGHEADFGRLYRTLAGEVDELVAELTGGPIRRS